MKHKKTPLTFIPLICNRSMMGRSGVHLTQLNTHSVLSATTTMLSVLKFNTSKFLCIHADLPKNVYQLLFFNIHMNHSSHGHLNKSCNGNFHYSPFKSWFACYSRYFFLSSETVVKNTESKMPGVEFLFKLN